MYVETESYLLCGETVKKWLYVCGLADSCIYVGLWLVWYMRL